MDDSLDSTLDREFTRATRLTVGALVALVARALVRHAAGLPEPATGRLISIPDRAPYGLSELHLRRGRLPEPGRAIRVEAATEAYRQIQAND